jgi:hypothetical protein
MYQMSPKAQGQKMEPMDENGMMQDWGLHMWKQGFGQPNGDMKSGFRMFGGLPGSPPSRNFMSRPLNLESPGTTKNILSPKFLDPYGNRIAQPIPMCRPLLTMTPNFLWKDGGNFENIAATPSQLMNIKFDRILNELKQSIEENTHRFNPNDQSGSHNQQGTANPEGMLDDSAQQIVTHQPISHPMQAQVHQPQQHQHHHHTHHHHQQHHQQQPPQAVTPQQQLPSAKEHVPSAS